MSDGLGRSPARFGAPPRTYTTDFPSGVKVRLSISWPSSSAYFVTCRPCHDGALATHTLRAPRCVTIHATEFPRCAATRSLANGADMMSSSVKCCAATECEMAAERTANARSVGRARDMGGRGGGRVGLGVACENMLSCADDRYAMRNGIA